MYVPRPCLLVLYFLYFLIAAPISFAVCDSSASVCDAMRATRRRAVPFATVGKRIAGASTPFAKSSAATCRADLPSPQIIGMKAVGE